MEKVTQVCCAILMEADRVLCAQRSTSMSHPLKWEFPGGKVEDGESVENALVREIFEELGLEIVLIEKFPSNFHQYSGKGPIELIPFLGKITGGTLDPKEHQSVVWERIGQLRELDWVEADFPIVLEFLDWHQNKAITQFRPISQ